MERSKTKNSKLVDYVSRLEEDNRRLAVRIDGSEATAQVLEEARELEKKLQDVRKDLADHVSAPAPELQKDTEKEEIVLA